MRRLALAFVLLAACDGDRDVLEVSGTAEVTEVRLASVLPGRLERVDVVEGQAVKKGDPLFALDAVDLKARRMVAEAALKQSEAGIELARAQRSAAEEQVEFVEKELKRIQGLASTGAVSARDLSQAENLRTQARAALRTATEAGDAALAGRGSAEANLAAIDSSLAQAAVSAPIDGVVLSRLREPGEVVTPGGVVVVLGDLAHPFVRVFVPVTWLGRVSVGDAAKVRTDGGATVDAKVVHVADAAEFTPRDVQTKEERVKQVFAVKLAVDATGGEVKAGMPVDVRFAPAAHARQ